MEKGELKKLNRAELLAMLMSVTQKCDDLEEELEIANRKLRDRDIEFSKAGSMADAVLRINGVMEAVDKAGQQYLENLKKMGQDGSLSGSAEAVLQKCKAIENETKDRCIKMVEKAKTESQAYWDEVYERIKKYSEATESLKDLIKKMDRQEEQNI